MSLLSKVVTATAKAKKVETLAETSRLKVFQVCFPKRIISWVLVSSRIKFLIEGQGAIPLKFSRYPPMSYIHAGLRLCTNLILSLLPGYPWSMLRGISYPYMLICGKSRQQRNYGRSKQSENFLGPLVWKRLVLQTKVAKSQRGVTPCYFASEGFKPGPQILQHQPIPTDFTFPKQLGLAYSIDQPCKPMRKVEVGREEVFLALRTPFLSLVKRRQNSGQKVLNPPLSRVTSILSVTRSGTSSKSLLLNADGSEKSKNYEPLIRLTTCFSFLHSV